MRRFDPALVGLGLGVMLAAAAARAQGVSAPGGPNIGNSGAAIEFIGAAAREITVQPDPKDRSVTVRYPIKLPSDYPSGPFTVTPTAVIRGIRDESILLPRFSAEIIASAGAERSEIRVALDLSKPMKPGIYMVELRIEAPEAQPRFVTVSIVLPPARIDAPPRQVIEIIDGEPPRLPALHLHESSGLSRISITDIRQIAPLRRSEMDVSSMLHFPVPELPIDPNGTADITPELIGAFDLGTSSGTVRISAHELEQPVDVPYEVRMRRGFQWIALAAAAGMILGYLLREVLVRLIALGDAWRKASDMLTRLEVEARRRPDALFTEAVQTAVNALKDKRRSYDKAVIEAAVQEAGTALEEAIKDWKDRKDKAREDFDDLSKALDEDYRLPPALRARLAAEAARLAGAANRLNAGDAAGAAELLGALRNDLTRAATTLGEEWNEQVRRHLANLAPIDTFAGEIQGVQGDCNTLDLNDSSTRLNERLERIDRLHGKIARLEARILEEVREAADGIVRIAAVAGKQPLVAALGEELGRVVAMHQERPDEPERILLALGANAALPRLLGEALRKLLPDSASPEFKEQLASRIQKGDCRGAARLVEDEICKPSLEGSAQGEKPPAVEKPASREPLALDAGAPAAVHTGAAVLPDTDSAPLFAFMVEKPAFRMAARLGAALITGTIVVLAAMGTYGKPTFVGTPQELWEIFLWAFGLNVVGAQALTTLAERLSTR